MNSTNMNGQQSGRLPSINTLIKPDQVNKIPVLPEGATKQKYYQGVTGLWATLQSKPQDSPEYMEAHQKLASVTSQIRILMQQRKQQEGTQQTGARPPSSGQQGQQAPPALQQPQLGQPQPQQTQVPQPAVPTNPNQQRPQFSQRVIDKVKGFNFAIPPNIQAQGPQIANKHLSDTRLKYANALQRFETAHEKLGGMDKMVRDRQSQGRPLMPADEQQYLEQKRRFEANREEARAFLEKFQETQNQIKMSLGHSQAGSGGNAGAESMKREPSQNGGLPATTQNEQQSQAHTVSSALDAARSQGNQGGSSEMSPPHPSQPAHAAVNQPSTSHPPVQTQPQNNQPQHNPTQPNPKNEPRPQEQTLNSSHPNAPSQNQPEGQAFPLSHEAAMQFARSYSNPNINAPYPQNPPQSASHSHPPHSTNTNTNTNNNREHQPMTNTHSKMPIPKDLNFPLPQPVSMGQSRPTMTNGPHVAGPIGQPAIQKHPGYVLEGDGERVLSKKKLEELVRQVTGATGSEGDEGETLTAEVEEVSLPFLRSRLLPSVLTASNRRCFKSQMTSLTKSLCLPVNSLNYGILPPLNCAIFNLYWNATTTFASLASHRTRLEP